MLMSSRVAADTSGTEVLDLLGKLDQDGNGVITVEEFKATVRADPRLLECFGRLFGVNEGGTGEVSTGPPSPRPPHGAANPDSATCDPCPMMSGGQGGVC